MPACIYILPNCNHYIKYTWMVRCSCRITVLLLFLKASTIENSLKFALISTWAKPREPRRDEQRPNKCMSESLLPRTKDAPAPAAELSRARLEAGGHGGTNLCPENCSWDSASVRVRLKCPHRNSHA